MKARRFNRHDTQLIAELRAGALKVLRKEAKDHPTIKPGRIGGRVCLATNEVYREEAVEWFRHAFSRAAFDMNLLLGEDLRFWEWVEGELDLRPIEVVMGKDTI